MCPFMLVELQSGDMLLKESCWVLLSVEMSAPVRSATGSAP